MHCEFLVTGTSSIKWKSISDCYKSVIFNVRRIISSCKNNRGIFNFFKSEKIGLYISNDIDSVVLIHACWLAHIEIAMINTRLTRHEMINQMNSVDIATIVHTLPLELEGFNLYHFNDLTQLDKHDVSGYKFNLESIASIMFTSGTTGPQKLCLKRLIII